MPPYTCEKCAKVFTQKSGYDAHLARKKPCTKSTVLNAVIEAKVEEKVKEVVRAYTSKGEITKETLPSFFEDLHNLLWNRAGLNPERALEHLTFFFAYRMIEQQADALNLPQECRWSYIASIKNENDLFETIKKGVSAFWKRRETKPFFKPHEIKKVDIVYDIVQQINRISLATLQETDTLGDIFEYMLGRGMSTMSDEGQYFTSRAICKLAFKLAYQIKKTLRRADGKLCTFADWFCGTGGFPAEFVKGMKANLSDIDWKRDAGSIYSQDMNLSSVTTTLLNLLILTGTAFGSETIRSSNSFSDPIVRGSGAPFPELEIDYCFMNPPYGGDKSKGKEYKFAYAKKVKAEDGSTSVKYFVNDDIRSIGIEDDDKVSAGVQLSMATLAKDGGVCCIVLPQGFFFGASKKAVELRKKIAEEYKIWFVVDIASGAFANTGTKTSMLLYQRGVGPTEMVKFIGMDEKELTEASLEDLRGKNYSLNYKQYLAQEAVEVEGFEMVKLRDIVSFKAEKSKKDKNSYVYIDIGSVDKGQFKTGETIAKQELPGRAQYSVNVGDILLGTVRPNLEHYLLISPEIYRDNLIVSNGFSIMRCDTSKVLPTYLYSVLTLPSSTSYLTERATGTTYPVIDDDIIGAMEIPLPSLERQQQIVEAIDGWTTLAHQEEQALKTLEKQVMFQVKEMGRGKERVKLGSIATFTFGYGIKSEDFGESGSPIIKTKNFQNGGVTILSDNPRTEKKYDEKYRIKTGDLLMVVDGACGESAIWREHEDGWLNQHVAKLHIENEVTRMFVAFSMKSDSFKEYIQSNVVVTTIPHMQRDVAKNFELPLPPLTEQQTLQSDFDEIRHKHAKIAAYKAKAQEAIQRLIPGA